MAVTIAPQKYSGRVRPMVIGSGVKAFTAGGDTAYPFFTFEGKMPHAPRIGIQVPDCVPDDWAESKAPHCRGKRRRIGSRSPAVSRSKRRAVSSG